MFSKEFIKRYRLDLFNDVPVFETRYFAQKFIDEYISKWYPTDGFIIDSVEDGFRIFFKGKVIIDKFDEPLIKYTYN